MSTPQDVPAGTLVIVRLWSWKPHKLVQDAEAGAARGEERLYAFSTYAMRRSEDETVEDTVRRVALYCRDDIGLSVRKASWATAVELQELGCEVLESMQPLHHVDVVLGTPDTLLDVAQAVAQLFDQREGTRPCD